MRKPRSTSSGNKGRSSFAGTVTPSAAAQSSVKDTNGGSTSDDNGNGPPKLGVSEIGLIGPLAATTFALAFDIGYFSAIDIGWFTLFNVSEHIVFAIRAIPIAVAVSTLLGILLYARHFDEWKVFEKRTYIARAIVIIISAIWITVLGPVLS
jgi:hypothetical protein